MPANVGAFALITVIDVCEVRIRDLGDLPDASGRRGSPDIRCGVPPRVFNRIDVPIAVVSQIGGLRGSLKIGVIEQHFVMRFAFPVGSASAVAVVANTWHEVSVSEGASGSIASRLSKDIWASPIARGQVRRDCRNVADPRILLIDDDTVGAAALIIA